MNCFEARHPQKLQNLSRKSAPSLYVFQVPMDHRVHVARRCRRRGGIDRNTNSNLGRRQILVLWILRPYMTYSQTRICTLTRAHTNALTQTLTHTRMRSHIYVRAQAHPRTSAHQHISQTANNGSSSQLAAVTSNKPSSKCS